VKTKSTVSFLEWLGQQIGREDGVGDLARYFFEPGKGSRIPKVVPSGYEVLSVRLLKKVAPTARYMFNRMLDRAWREFHSGNSGPGAATDALRSFVERQRHAGRTMFVEPAMKRLEKAVKSIHERGENQVWDKISIQEIKGPPAYVDYKMGYTTNLGSYESARVSVGVSIPCYPEELDEATAFARAYVDSEVAQEILKIRGETLRNDAEPQLLTEEEEKSVPENPVDDPQELAEDEDVLDEDEDELDAVWKVADIDGDIGI